MYIKYRQYANEHWDSAIDCDDLFEILAESSNADFLNYNLPFSSLDGRKWSCLLEHNPQFADKCDKWSEFSALDLICLLSEQPQFADKCDKWDEFSDDEWEDLLKDHPDFVKYKK